MPKRQVLEGIFYVLRTGCQWKALPKEDENGLPLAVILSGANTHDVKLLDDTLDHIVVLRPEPDEGHPQNLCLDAGYTGSGEKVCSRGYTPHIRPRGEEKKELERNPKLKKLRFVRILCVSDIRHNHAIA